MFPTINPTTTKAWQELQQHFNEMKNVHMRELFRDDPDRFKKFSLHDNGIIFDYSKKHTQRKNGSTAPATGR